MNFQWHWAAPRVHESQCTWQNKLTFFGGLLQVFSCLLTVVFFMGVGLYSCIIFSFFFASAIYYLLSTGKYIDDFKFVQGKEMHFGKVLEFDGVSVDQCAKLCIEEESVHCQTFAYCGNYTKCKLMSSTPKHLGPGYITSSDFCNLYISKLKFNWIIYDDVQTVYHTTIYIYFTPTRFWFFFRF